MAQSEDTELRDLVLKALDINGSLAKIRALLRANIFLAFEDDCENRKQNESLDKILKIPEGKISLCIIQEFLEFCNLKNTLFVYTAETRQGKEYNYEKIIAEKINVPKLDRDKEPVLLTIVKNIMKPSQNNHYSIEDNRRQSETKSSPREDENCTYIVHDDTSTVSSQSQSDNSSDEKNKIDLRLHLDNSDTETSSDSLKDKNKCVYIPSKQNCSTVSENSVENNLLQTAMRQDIQNLTTYKVWDKKDNSRYDSKPMNNSSTESTSYMELKPLDPIDKVLHNTTGLPLVENMFMLKTPLSVCQTDSISSVHGLNSNSDESCNKDNVSGRSTEQSLHSHRETGKNDTDTMEYSYDFSSPKFDEKQTLEHKDSELVHEKIKASMLDHSPSSQSSVSLSDVADLISEKNDSVQSKNDSNISYNLKLSNKSNKQENEQVKAISNDSGDFSESSVPSLSNLSLDVHSD